MKKYEGIYVCRQENRIGIKWIPAVGIDNTPSFGLGRTDNFSRRHYQHNKLSSKQKGIKVPFIYEWKFDPLKYDSILSKNINAIEDIFHTKLDELGYNRDGLEVFYGRSKKSIKGLCKIGEFLSEDFFLRLKKYLFSDEDIFSDNEIKPYWSQEFDIEQTINIMLDGSWVVQKQDTGYGKSTLIVLTILEMLKRGINDSQCIISTIPSTFSEIEKLFHEFFYFRNKSYSGELEIVDMSDIVNGKVKFKPKGQIILVSKQFLDGYTKYLKLIKLENKKCLGTITKEELEEIEKNETYRKFENFKEKINFKFVHFDEPHNATNTQHSANMMSLFENSIFNFLSATSEKVELKYKDRIKLKNTFENSVHKYMKIWLENMNESTPFDINYEKFIDEWTHTETQDRENKDLYIKSRIDYFIENKDKEIQNSLFRIIDVVYLTNTIKNRKGYQEELIKRNILTDYGFNIETIFYTENLDLLENMMSDIFKDERIGGDGIDPGIKKMSTLSIISKFNKDKNIKNEPIDFEKNLTVLIKVPYFSKYKNEYDDINDMTLNPNIEKSYNVFKKLGLLDRYNVLKVQTTGVSINEEEVQSLNSSKLKMYIENKHEQSISQGKNLIILEGSKLDTGIDLPNINLNLLINLSNISSYIVTRQFIGRGKRASEGKNFVFYLDFNIESRLTMDFYIKCSNFKYLDSDELSTYLRNLNIIDYTNDNYFEYKNDENRLKKLENRIREEIEQIFENISTGSFKKLGNDGCIESYNLFYNEEHKGFSVGEDKNDSIKGKSKSKIEVPEREKQKIEETLKKLEKYKVVHLIFHYYINELIYNNVFYSFEDLLEGIKNDNIFNDVFKEVLIKIGIDKQYVVLIDIDNIIDELDTSDSKLDSKLFYYNNSNINLDV